MHIIVGITIELPALLHVEDVKPTYYILYKVNSLNAFTYKDTYQTFKINCEYKGTLQFS